MISVRDTRPADGTALDALRDEATAEAADKRGGPELLAELSNDSDHAPTVTLLALIGDVPVGLASGRARRGCLTVSELFVSAGARGVGVGTELLSNLLAGARDSGCSRVEAVALPGDRDTKNFFESHGLTARRIVVGRSTAP